MNYTHKARQPYGFYNSGRERLLLLKLLTLLFSVCIIIDIYSSSRYKEGGIAFFLKTIVFKTILHRDYDCHAIVATSTLHLFIKKIRGKLSDTIKVQYRQKQCDIWYEKHHQYWWGSFKNLIDFDEFFKRIITRFCKVLNWLRRIYVGAQSPHDELSVMQLCQPCCVLALYQLLPPISKGDPEIGPDRVRGSAANGCEWLRC